MLGAGKQFVRHVVPAILKPLRVLWNELIAFVFVAFGVLVGFSTYRKYQAEQANADLVVLMAIVGGGFFTLLLLWLGFASWLRARRISRG